MDDQPTLFLVDDDPAVLDSLSNLAATSGFQSEAFPSAEEFLTGFRADRDGCLVVDVRMPGMSGLDLQAELRASGCRIPIIVITGYGDIPMSVQAMKAGAVTFLAKPFAPEDLLEAIRQALDEVAARRRGWVARAGFESNMKQLSDGELQVLAHLARGRTNAAIASKMGLGLRTIQFRRSSLMKKLEVGSKEELMELLFELNWKSLNPD